MGEPLSKAELDRVTAAWRDDLAARYPSAGEPAAKAVTVPAEVKAGDRVVIDAVIGAIAPVIHALEQKTVALQTRIEELEAQRDEMKYCGVWREGKEYSPGSFTTHDGAMFHANRKTSEKPGASGDWVMAAKSGQPVGRAAF